MADSLHEDSEKNSSTGLNQSEPSLDIDAAKGRRVIPSGTPSDIPDGGLVAWLQCVGSFILFFNSWGIVNTFGKCGEYAGLPNRSNILPGVFQTYYERTLLPNESASNISWIGSIQASLLILLCTVTGALYDHGYFRALIITGSFAVTFGMMMTSLCTTYWQLVLAQGVVVGTGCGCLFLPSVAILPSYFSKKKALAQGIAASGGSVGGMIYLILFHQLLPRIGFGWATRVMAFFMLGTLLIPLLCMRTRVKPSAQRRLIDLAAWKEPPYALFGAAELFGFMGLYVPFFYAQLYAIEKVILTENLAFYLLVVLNAGSIFGRIIPNYLADKAGPMNILIPCAVATAILGFLWIGISTAGGIFVFCALYGFFSGSFVSLPITTAVTLSPSLGVVGVRMGMLFVPIGLGILVGNPIAGACLRGGWTGLEAFCGATVMVSGFGIVAARVARVGMGMTAKA